jgi:uncharacterized protein YecE (DUF72 family)
LRWKLSRFQGLLACELQHRTWFTDEVDHLLMDFQVACVAADPAVVPRAATPCGWQDLQYSRLHWSPRMYYSAYHEGMRDRLRTSHGEIWCIFDNTAEGAATHDALAVLRDA